MAVEIAHYLNVELGPLVSRPFLDAATIPASFANGYAAGEVLLRAEVIPPSTFESLVDTDDSDEGAGSRVLQNWESLLPALAKLSVRLKRSQVRARAVPSAKKQKKNICADARVRQHTTYYLPTHHPLTRPLSLPPSLPPLSLSLFVGSQHHHRDSRCRNRAPRSRETLPRTRRNRRCDLDSKQLRKRRWRCAAQGHICG